MEIDVDQAKKDCKEAETSINKLISELRNKYPNLDIRAYHHNSCNVRNENRISIQCYLYIN